MKRRTVGKKGSRFIRTMCYSLVAMLYLPSSGLCNDVANTTQPSQTQTSSPTVINAGSTDLSSLNVGHGETLVIDFSGQSSLSLTGNLQNAGTIYGISTNTASTGVTISANNITNTISGLISTVLPAGGIPGFNMGSLVPSLNLSLIAVQNIINSGTISSAGNLAMQAGGSITNALPQGITGPSPVMQAMQNITMQAANLTNTGNIAALLGSINAYTSNLTNSMGTLQALNGSVSVRNLIGNTLTVNNVLGNISAKDSITMAAVNNLVQNGSTCLGVFGGNLTARDIMFQAPNGQVNVNVDNLNGGVNLFGDELNVNAKVGDLNIASINSGSSNVLATGGDLDLSGLFKAGPTFFTNGGNLIGLAGGNITAISAPENSLINAAAGNGHGGEIVLSSGVSYDLRIPDCA
jgi:hypothetical protein